MCIVMPICRPSSIGQDIRVSTLDLNCVLTKRSTSGELRAISKVANPWMIMNIYEAFRIQRDFREFIQLMTWIAANWTACESSNYFKL